MEMISRVNVTNMHCSNCALTIEHYFNDLKNIKARVILSENIVIFTYDDNEWNLKKIALELKKIGYGVKKEGKISWELIRLIISIILAIPFLWMMLAHLGLEKLTVKFLFNPYFQLIIASIVLIISGFPFFKGMIRDFKNRRLGMDVLVSLGTSIAYLFSIYLMFKKENQQLIQEGNYQHLHLYFETTVVLLTLIQLGKFLENKAKRKTANALKDLMTLTSKSANVLSDGKIIEKPTDQINIGEQIIVKQGETIPLDGKIIQGQGSINESLISGESKPVLKNLDDEVIGGTILEEGNLIIKIHKSLKNNYLSRIIDAVEKAQNEKPHIQKIADKVASYFVPGVILISIICFLVSYFFILKDFTLSLERAVAILVVSCPCSLGLATPLSIMVGTSRAAKSGIIYKNGEIFEKIKKINAICFDKTGTLSQGIFNVTYCSNEQYLNIVYTLESFSNHPIAKSLVNYALEKKASLVKEMKVEEIIGKGIQGKLQDDIYYIGNRKWLLNEDNNLEKGLEIVLIKNNQEVANFILEDSLKKEAFQTIKFLQQKNILTYMITGDNQQIAYSVADKLNISHEHVYYQVEPFEKANIIKDIQNKGYNVAFVGDGVNDALALNCASLGISMAKGSDVAINSSDITLANNNLLNINKALNLSYKVLSNIKENFIWAFSYNIIAIPLAFMGILSPMIAGLCMAFSNIFVVGNALRLYGVKIDE